MSVSINGSTITFTGSGPLTDAIVFPSLTTTTTNVVIVGYSSIDINAFATTNINSVLIPTTVTSIGVRAFYNCTSLNSVTFTSPSTLVSIGNDAFVNNTALISFIVPPNVLSIGLTAFAGSGLNNVIVYTPTATAFNLTAKTNVSFFGRTVILRIIRKIAVVAGWNLFGVSMNAVLSSSETTSDQSSINQIYVNNNDGAGYVKVVGYNLVADRGYWVNCKSSGFIYVTTII